MKFLGLLVALFILVGSLCGVGLPQVNATTSTTTIPIQTTLAITTTTLTTTTIHTSTLSFDVTTFITSATITNEPTVITTTTTTDVTEITITTSSRTTTTSTNDGYQVISTSSTLVATNIPSTLPVTTTSNTVATVYVTSLVGYGGAESAASMVNAANVLAELLVLVALILGLYGVQRGEFDTKAFLGLAILIAVLVLFSAIVGNF